jgi:hypothetical protein
VRQQKSGNPVDALLDFWVFMPYSRARKEEHGCFGDHFLRRDGHVLLVFIFVAKRSELSYGPLRNIEVATEPAYYVGGSLGTPSGWVTTGVTRRRRCFRVF